MVKSSIVLRKYYDVTTEKRIYYGTSEAWVRRWDRGYHRTTHEFLPKNKRVLIIGGGLIGVDIATALIPMDNQIIIVKRTTDFGEDMEMIAKNLSIKMMKEKKQFLVIILI